MFFIGNTKFGRVFQFGPNFVFPIKKLTKRIFLILLKFLRDFIGLKIPVWKIARDANFVITFYNCKFTFVKFYIYKFYICKIFNLHFYCCPKSIDAFIIDTFIIFRQQKYI